MNRIFQMRYCTLFQVKMLQKYLRSKLEVERKPTGSAGPGRVGVESVQVSNFFFTFLYFRSLLSYKGVQYLN